MGSKHDVLTEEEIKNAKIDKSLEKYIEKFISENPQIKTLNILDWGCGRGRSVILLREMGFNAFGIDIDERTLKNGYPLFEGRGLNPSEIIFHVDKIKDFPDGFFHIIFSELVVEHVADLREFVKEQSRLTVAGGIGLHTFPGSKFIFEPHLKIPFVHWLPKNTIRKILIALFSMLGMGPSKKIWPETTGKSFWESCEVFYQYLDKKTHYRDIDTIKDEFKHNSFEAFSIIIKPKFKLLTQSYVVKNGFPNCNIQVFTKK